MTAPDTSVPHRFVRLAPALDQHATAMPTSLRLPAEPVTPGQIRARISA